MKFHNHQMRCMKKTDCFSMLMRWFCFSFLLLGACSSEKSAQGKWVQFEEWDKNGNHVLDGGEFRSGYLGTELYKYWTCGKKAGACSCVVTVVFDYLDSDRNGRIQEREWSRRQMRYVIGPDQPTWAEWDDDHDSTLDRQEFANHAINENLCGKFDPNTDRLISPEDLATVLFNICDQDKDASIGAMEFYLWEIYQKGVE